jgi:hypothetical protein
MLTTLNGHQLLKTDVTSPSAPGFDIRPIGIASAIYVLAVTALRNTEEYKKQVGSLISPLDFAHGKAGGAEAIVHTVRSQLDARPNTIAIDLDVDNAFQTPFRQKLLDLAYKAPILGPLLKMLYLNPTNIIFNSKSSAPFRVTTERGVAQGDPLSMDLFCAVLSEALAPVDAGLTATNVTLPRFADNTTVVGAVENSFDTTVKIRNALVPTGMQLKMVKCKALLPASLSPAASVMAMARANALGIKIVDGITLCGSPIGSSAYCKSVVQSTFEAACSRMNLIEQLAHFDSTAGGISKQNALVLLRYCVVPASVVHLMRSTPPDLVKEAAATFDDKTETTILSIINSLSLVSTNEERARFNERLHLDAVGGGGGLASAVSLADAAYIGSMALTACHAAKFLPPGTSLGAAFPAAKKLFDNGILREVDSIKDVSLADIANDAVPKVQRHPHDAAPRGTHHERARCRRLAAGPRQPPIAGHGRGKRLPHDRARQGQGAHDRQRRASDRLPALARPSCLVRTPRGPTRRPQLAHLPRLRARAAAERQRDPEPAAGGRERAARLLNYQREGGGLLARALLPRRRPPQRRRHRQGRPPQRRQHGAGDLTAP